MATPPTSPLHTTELLELILSHLPERDLLLAQRTCKDWNTLISTSPLLQSLLYFRSAPNPPTTTPASPSYTLNPLLSSSFPAIFPQDHRLHPKDDPAWAPYLDDLNLSFLLTASTNKFFYSSFHKRPEAFRRRDASWRRMHISSPPVRTVVFRCNVSTMGGGFMSECVVRAGDTPSPSPENPEQEYANNDTERPRISAVTYTNRSGEFATREEIDLRREGGLKMDVLYDYLFNEICIGDIPSGGCQIYFARGVYPADDEVKARAESYEDITLPTLVDWRAGAGKDDAGVTMMVEFHHTRSCVVEADESFPQFRSEAHRDLHVGPMRDLYSGMYPDDEDLYL